MFTSQQSQQPQPQQTAIPMPHIAAGPLGDGTDLLPAAIDGVASAAPSGMSAFLNNGRLQQSAAFAVASVRVPRKQVDFKFSVAEDAACLWHLAKCAKTGAGSCFESLRVKLARA